MKENKVTITSGCAVDENIYYISSRLNNLPIDEPYSRLFFYQEKTEEKWFYHDLPKWNIVSTCFKPSTPTDERAVCALSEEGDVEILMRSGTVIEKIIDAGLESDRGIGYLTRIRCVDGDLYACGDQNQVYKRNNGQWNHIDDGILVSSSFEIPAKAKNMRAAILNAVREDSCLYDIAGQSSNDIYAVGANGCILHYNGRKWSRLKQITAADLYEIHLTESNDLIIVGSKGTVISGNQKSGFKVELRKKYDSDFTSISEHQGELFIGASDGIYKKTDTTLIRLPLNLHDISNIESSGNVLWAASSNKILKYENQQWSVIKHIDNPQD
jgi:hypothetical protein